MPILSSILGSIELSKGLGGFVVDMLDKSDIERYTRGLQTPSTILSKRDAAIQKKYDIDPFYLLNEPTEAIRRQS